MADRLTAGERSSNMSLIRSTDTAPERAVRSLLHRSGFRFRLYGRQLPGTPDIVLPKYSTVIMVHGCFWHQHKGCKYSFTPVSNTSYWTPKLLRNIQRDKMAVQNLRKLGWRVIVVWECEIKNMDRLAKRLISAVCGKKRLCRISASADRRSVAK